MAVREAIDAAELCERAEALVPLLRANAVETERGGRVATASMAALAAAGVFRMTAPRAFGGYEAPMATQVGVLTSIARGCGSTSWVAAVYSVGVWVAGCFSDRAQDEVLAQPDARVTLVAAPTGALAPTDGGYVLNGRWAFNTGCLDGHWAIVGAPRPAQEDPGRDGLVALVPLVFSVPIHVAQTDEHAHAQARGPVEWLFHKGLKQGPQIVFPPGYMSPGSMRGLLTNGFSGFGGMSYEDLLRAGMVVAGSADSVGEELERLRDQLGFGAVNLLFCIGDMPHEHVVESMELFASRVMPAFRSAAP